MPIPVLTQYSDTEIQTKIIVPLTTTYPEVLWCADPQAAGIKADITPLVTIPNSHGKYAGLEHLLTSIVAFHLFYEGTDKAYEKFTSLQKKEEALTKGSFKKIHQLAKQVTQNKESFYEMVRAMLIYREIGKTPTSIENAKKAGVEIFDHNDFVKTVLEQELHVIKLIIPSFATLPSQAQTLLPKTTTAMEANYSQVLHMEGTEQNMFGPFHKSVLQNKIEPGALSFAFLIQLCEASSSSAQQKPGLQALTENTYQEYQLIHKSFMAIKNRTITTNHDALKQYANSKAKQLAISLNNATLLRLGCMLRLYTKEDSKLLADAFYTLSVSEQNLLHSVFDAAEDKFSKIPTHIPDVLLNLANFQVTEEPRQLKMVRALRGAICIAHILSNISQNNTSKRPLNFAQLAAISLKNPGFFTSCDINLFNADEKNNIVYNISDLSIILKLYGFATQEEQTGFMQLLSVAGCLEDAPLLTEHSYGDRQSLQARHNWLVKVTQLAFFARKIGQERWQQTLPEWMRHNQSNIKNILTQLKFTTDKKPRRQEYDLMVVLGATAPTMQKRLVYSKTLIEQNESPIKIKELLLLTGERTATSAGDTEEHIKQTAHAQNISINQLQEQHLMRELYKKCKGNGKFSTIPAIFLNAFKSTSKPRADLEDTLLALIQWLTDHKPTVNSILFVSNAPHINPQQETIWFVLQRASLLHLTYEVVGEDCLSNMPPLTNIVGALGSSLFWGYPRVEKMLDHPNTIQQLKAIAETLSFDAQTKLTPTKPDFGWPEINTIEKGLFVTAAVTGTLFMLYKMFPSSSVNWCETAKAIVNPFLTGNKKFH